MKKEKLIYLSPETETLVVRAEGVICGSYGAQGKAGTVSVGNVYDFGDDDE